MPGRALTGLIPAARDENTDHRMKLLRRPPPSADALEEADLAETLVAPTATFPTLASVGRRFGSSRPNRSDSVRRHGMAEPRQRSMMFRRCFGGPRSASDQYETSFSSPRAQAMAAGPDNVGTRRRWYHSVDGACVFSAPATVAPSTAPTTGCPRQSDQLPQGIRSGTGQYSGADALVLRRTRNTDRGVQVR